MAVISELDALMNKISFITSQAEALKFDYVNGNTRRALFMSQVNCKSDDILEAI